MPYAPIPIPAVGGTVLAILTRQKLRAGAVQKLRETSAGFSPPVAWVGDIPVSAKSQEAFTYDAEVTEHAVESGSIFSDHVILKPIKLDLSFEVTNWEQGSAKYALELLEQVWRNREPVELLTEHKVLSNMILTRIDATNALPNWGSLVFRATFQELKLVTLETAKVPAAKVTPTEETGGPATPKSAESPVDAGQSSLISKTVDSVLGIFK